MIRYIKRWWQRQCDEMDAKDARDVDLNRFVYNKYYRPYELMSSLSSDGTNSGETAETRSAYIVKKVL